MHRREGRISTAFELTSSRYAKVLTGLAGCWNAVPPCNCIYIVVNEQVVCVCSTRFRT